MNAFDVTLHGMHLFDPETETTNNSEVTYLATDYHEGADFLHVTLANYDFQLSIMKDNIFTMKVTEVAEE